MTSSVLEKTPAIQGLTIDRQMLIFALQDGRVVGALFAWFPRLREGTQREREHWQLIGAGSGVHWPDLDEDVGVENLLLGRRSTETARSLENWRASRRDTTKTT